MRTDRLSKVVKLGVFLPSLMRRTVERSRFATFATRPTLTFRSRLQRLSRLLMGRILGHICLTSQAFFAADMPQR